MPKNEQRSSGPHFVDIHVGGMLREKRREKGVSQDELAQSVGLTFQQVQKYEKGLNRISCSKLYDFARFLKTNVQYFFQGLDSNIYKFSESASYALGDHDGAANEDDMKAQLTELTSAFQDVKEPQIRLHILNLVRAISWK